jgi:dipeptidyl-peptidase 4
MTKHLHFLLVALIVVSADLTFAKKPVTTDDAAEVSRGEGISGIVWAPDGESFAYEKSDKLQVFEVKAREHRELIRLAELEGPAVEVPSPEKFGWENRRVQEQTVQWFPDGKRLLLKVEGDLFTLDVADKKWTQLTKTDVDEADPKVSPDGRLVSFRRGNDLHIVNAGSGREKQLTKDGSSTIWNARLDWVYPEELAIGTAHWWSPDSRNIAYLQFDVSELHWYPHADLVKLRAVAEPQRFPKAGTPNADVRVGLVSASGGRTRWIDDVDGDKEIIGRVDWTPDSSSLSIIKMNRIQDRMTVNVVPLKGAARTLVEEKDKHWVNLTDEYQYLSKSPRLLWSSERDGHRHLYMIPTAGGEATQITEGQWDVTSIECVNEDTETVYFISTEKSPLERHLYSIQFDGADKKKLTKEAGSHGAAMSPGCRYYTHSFSSLTQPPRSTLRDIAGNEIEVLREPNLKIAVDFELVPEEIVTVRAKDGDVLYARLMKPAGFRKGRKYPAVVMVYGGPHAQSVRNSWSGADLKQALAHAGFVVWQLDNRGSAGRGHAFESKVYRRFGEQELADQVVGVKHLVKTGLVDPNRVGIYGWSYGGYMTLTALLHAPDVFSVGVAGAPVTDWRNYDTIYTERYMGVPAENEEAYRKSSPVHYGGNLEGDLLLIHNIEDDNVLFQNTMQMAANLQREDKPFDMMIYGQKSHGVSGQERKHLYRKILSYFEDKLGE